MCFTEQCRGKMEFYTFFIEKHTHKTNISTANQLRERQISVILKTMKEKNRSSWTVDKEYESKRKKKLINGIENGEQE